jgi:predicted metal-dependent hydrolase
LIVPIIQDEEFGAITVRKSARATQVRIRVAPNGTLRASMPLYAPMFLLKRLIKTSRDELRRMQHQAQPDTSYENGQQIGKSHTIVVRQARTLEVKRVKQQIVVNLPVNQSLTSSMVVAAIRNVVISALRIEAKSYLPKRLEYLSKQLGFSYHKVRFSHASSRWGSCSSQGTISLNIALMKLPFELIDYVLIHELSHTKQMNHSEQFWKLVAVGDPAYKTHRRALKNETPSI